MAKYALMRTPGHNHVYFIESGGMAQAELEIISQSLSCAITNVQDASIAGVPYITFNAEDKLSQSDIKIISQAAFAYAIFEQAGAGMLPVEKSPYEFLPATLSSMLKYTGKTNDIFTHTLINLALHSSDFAAMREINFLDPLAGKGTALFDAISRGYNAFGIEIGENAAKEAYQFIKKFLENGKYKHKNTVIKQSGANKAFTAQRRKLEITINGEHTREARIFEMIHCNSIHADKLFSKNMFHIMAADLPYGVQHSSVTQQGQSALTRNPKDLLAACLPSWYRVLKPGGAIAISWNVNVLPREDIAALLTSSGFTPPDKSVYSHFRHRVDQAIERDIIVGRKNRSASRI